MMPCGGVMAFCGGRDPQMGGELATTVTFDLHLKNFNSAHNFPTITHRAFIFNIG